MQTGSAPRMRPFPWWLLAVLCLAALLAYIGTINYDFVFDDDAQVLRNPSIRDWSQVWRFFSTDVWSFLNDQPGNYYRPFHMLAHAAGYAISGLQSYGYHSINILLHCLSTLLSALFYYRLTRDIWVSAAGGFLFALHPVHAESVSWIAGIPDPLCAVFYFGALVVFLNQDSAKERKTILCGALLFLGALFSKEMAFMLPLAAVWLDLCVSRKLRWGRYAALAVTFGIYTAFRIHALSHFQNAQSLINLNLHDRLLSSVVLLGEYVAKAFVPFNITAFHVFKPTVSIGDPRFIMSIMVILAFAAGAWLFRHERNMMFLIGFISISLLPVLNITGIGENVFTDRYLYIPSLGSCILIPLLAQKAARAKWLHLGVLDKKIALGFSGGVCIIFAYLLHNTAFMWKDNLTLYSETMNRSPDTAIIANNLSDCHFKAGRMKDAEYWSRRAEENWKRSHIQFPQLLCEVYVRLGFIYLNGGKTPEALEVLAKAAQISPNSPGVLQALTKLYLLQGNFAEARKTCEASLAIRPRNEMLQNNLAFILLNVGEIDKAIEHARTALEIFPKYGDAYLNLARGYSAKGLTEQAREAYNKALLHNQALKPAVDQELSRMK
jgi:protein O-mannosyl-transferase